jgi:RimJ/RimL family protein N-acetyltransferase
LIAGDTLAVMSDLVKLRPITLDEVSIFETHAVQRDADDPFNFFGWANPGLRRSVTDGTVFGDHTGKLAVVTAEGDELVGDIGWFPVHWSPTCVAVNMGISLFPHARGKGYGTAAQRRFAEYLFATSAVNRIQAQTDIDNIPEQRSLEKAGFTREGVARGAQFRAGEYRDMVGYSFIRADLRAGARGGDC